MNSAINLGDCAVFEEVYRAYYPALCFFAAKYVGDDESEDVVENLFFRIWKQKKKLLNSGHLKAFLYQATKNACLDFIKMQGRKDKRYASISMQTDAVNHDYLHNLVHTEVIAEIHRAINQLPTQCRKVISLEFIEGLSNEEVAKELSLSVQTVKNHKVRALKILKQQFSDNIPIVAVIHFFLS